MIQKNVKILSAFLRWSYSPHRPGQSIVIVALMLVGIVGMLGLVLDGGNAYLQRRRAQNAADGSSYAGAIALAQPTPTGEYPSQKDARILGQINAYAASNGITDPSTNVLPYYIDASGNQLSQVGLGNVPGNAKGVSVIPTLPFNTFFLNVLGEPNGTVKAAAKAIFWPLSGPANISPLTLPCSADVFTSCFNQGPPGYDLYQGAGSGSFGWLSWDNKSADQGYTAQELNPSIDTLSGYIDPHGICANGKLQDRNNGTQCWIHGNTGVNNGSEVGTQLDAWITRGLKGIPMIIPVYDLCEPIDSKTGLCKTTGGGTNTNYRVKGFAAFILKSYNLSTKRVSGYFTHYVEAGSFCKTDCDFDSGVNGVHLTQ